jgi:hypothetical protein
MPRTVEVDRVKFQIDQELVARPAGVATSDAVTMNWSAVTGFGADEPVYRIGCGKMKFAAKITAVEGAPRDLAEWKAGFAQNVTQVERVGRYGADASIVIVLPADHPPIRDGERAELPFSYPAKGFQLGTTTELADDDPPRLDLPRAIPVDGTRVALSATEGTEEFVTWLALANAKLPRKVVLLGKAVWQVNWATTTRPGELPTSTVELSRTSLDHNLNTRLTARNLPALGDGRVTPDYRKEASVNGYVRGELRVMSQEGDARVSTLNTWWGFDDEDRPIGQPVPHPMPAPGDETWFSPPRIGTGRGGS